MSGEQSTLIDPLPLSGSLIYVVDDNDMVGELVECILETRGFHPKVFLDPREALTSFKEESPRPFLLITDFVMDGLNGMELVQKCVEIQPSLKTILYSGNVGQECMRNHSVLPNHFLAKPFSPEILLNMVEGLKADAGV